jgi:uncharacterized protein YhfF
MTTIAVDQYWKAFLAKNPQMGSDTPFQVWYFGNSKEMARELAQLVISGRKIATASLATTNEIEPHNAPVDNGCSVVTDFEGMPMCVIQTTEIRHLPFKKVDAKFAFDEGEGDRSLEYWRDVHWEYFSREAAKFESEFNENSIVCCERFRLLFT